MKRKIVIDARTVAPVPHGMGRYVLGMAKGLDGVRSATGLDYEPVFLVHESLEKAGLPEELRSFRTRSCRSRIFHPREWREIPAVLRQEKADYFHSPTFCAFPRMPFRYACTVHDLNHLHFGRLSQRLYYRTLLRRFALGANRLLAVSEATRAELARWLNISEDRIQVAVNAIDLGLVHAVSDTGILERLGLVRGGYLLSVANSKPHKNVGTLIEAFTRAKKEGALGGLQLVVVLEAQQASPPPAGVVVLSQISDAQVRALIEGALAAVSPSRYEGFGLFPVEAAALGIPVLASDIPPHREGLGLLAENEVAWVRPDDQEGWINAMRRACDGGLAAPSASTGLALRRRYGSEALGSFLDGLYRDVLTKSL